MCGRYALSLPGGAVRAHIEEELQRPVAAWEDEEDYNPARGYNIAPRTRNPIILRGGASDGAVEPHDDEQPEEQENGKASKEKVLRIENMQWGLIPHWMKRAPDSGGMLKTINAREDTINEGGSMWKSIRGRKRCIVVAEGFYEWLHKGTERIPHFIKRKDGKLMCLAGLWDSVTYEGEEKPLHTYTIVTVDSNKQMTFLHNRMPAILSDADSIATWLDTSDGAWSPKVANLLKPFEGDLEIYPVPREVGKVGTQSADYLKPVSERKGNIASFFAKQSAEKEDKQERTSSPEVKKKPASPDEVQAEEFAKEIHAKIGSPNKNQEPTSPPGRSPSFERAASSDQADADKTHQPQSQGKGTRKGKFSADKVEETDLPLNPDEGDDITLASPSPKQRGKTEDGAIVLDDQSDEEAGDSKKDPILVDGLSSSPETRTTRSSKRNSRSETTKVESAAKGQGSGNKRKRRASPEAASKSAKSKRVGTPKSKGKKGAGSHKTSTDKEGNEKLENFFQIEDDSS